MKRYLFILFFFGIGCKTVNECYQGYVYDCSHRPVEKASVTENLAKKKITFTDKAGYFKLLRSKGIVADMIIEKEGYITDTIKTVWSHAGESLDYTFLTKKKDTVKIFPVVSGTVYDRANNKPLDNVQVFDMLGNQLTNTNLNGFFKLNKFPTSESIVLKRDNYRTDSIKLYKVIDKRTQQISFLSDYDNSKYFLAPIKLNDK